MENPLLHRPRGYIISIAWLYFFDCGTWPHPQAVADSMTKSQAFPRLVKVVKNVTKVTNGELPDVAL
jgi:hypothetical protein